MTSLGHPLRIGKGNVLADFVHPNLSEEASNVCASIDIFGASIEKVLIRWEVSKSNLQ